MQYWIYFPVQGYYHNDCTQALIMISYYRLQYKLHPSDDVPIEKEEWLAVSKKYSQDQMKQLLMVRHQMDVTLIYMSAIAKDEYDRGHFVCLYRSSRQAPVSMTSSTSSHELQPSGLSW